jgi:hypothetical protein
MILLLSSVSYSIFTIPIFTAFWLYGLFGYDEDEIGTDDEAAIEYAEYAESDDNEEE